MCKGEEFYLPVLLTWGGHDVCASFQYGDYDPNVHKRGFLAQEELLPKRVRSSAKWRSRFPGLVVFCVTEPFAEKVSVGLPVGCMLLRSGFLTKANNPKRCIEGGEFKLFLTYFNKNQKQTFSFFSRFHPACISLRWPRDSLPVLHAWEGWASAGRSQGTGLSVPC